MVLFAQVAGEHWLACAPTSLREAKQGGKGL
jgi:hypothetical protein